MNDEKTAALTEITEITENKEAAQDEPKINAATESAENQYINFGEPVSENGGEYPHNSDTGAEQADYDAKAKAAGMLKQIFSITMSLISLTVLIYGAVFTVEKLDISVESITRSLITNVVGRKVVSSNYESSEIYETEKNAEAEKETAAHSETNGISEEYSVPYFKLSLINETPYEPDMDEILSMPRSIPTAGELYEKYGENAPLVLVLHTHATESFSDTAADNYRSHDKAENVCAIGDIVTKILNDSGIAALHSTELFDSPDFNMAYYNASLEIREYLEKYPSISYIIDIHRDSMLLDDGTYYAPTASIDFPHSEEKSSAAQLMLVVGTDHGGSGHTGWRNNLALAARLQCGIMGDYPNLMRDINLRSASFNEQYTLGSLLLEVGSCASDFEEAALSAEIFARQLAREIIG